MFKVILVIASIFLTLTAILFSTTNFQQQIVVEKNNTLKQAIDLKPQKYKDRYCNMTINDIDYSAQAILANNDTLFFDDIGCLINWLHKQTNQRNIKLFIYAKDTKHYIDIKKAFYIQGEKTPMHYGFGAYENPQINSIQYEKIEELILGNN